MVDLSKIDIMLYVDIRTIITCICIGKIFKSSTLTRKLDNKLIPYILLTIGLLFQFAFTGFNIISASTGIISAATAIGIHQSGKQLFTFHKGGNNNDKNCN